MGFWGFAGDEVFHDPLLLCHSAGLITALTSVYQVPVTNYLWELDSTFLTFPVSFSGTAPAAPLAGK